MIVSRITPRIKLTRKNRLLSMGLEMGLGVCACLDVGVCVREIRRYAAKFIYCATLAENAFARDVEVRLAAWDCLFATFTLKCAVHEVFPGKVRLCSLRIVASRDG